MQQITSVEKLDFYQSKAKAFFEHLHLDYHCEDCGEPLRLNGTEIDCENGCFEEDTRNFFPGQ